MLSSNPVRPRAPQKVVEDAKSAWSHRARGAVATLVFDSLVEAGDTPAHHRLTFCYADVRFQVTVDRIGNLSVVSGVGPGQVQEVMRPDGTAGACHGHPSGYFSTDPISPGIVRLSFRTDDWHGSIFTDWFRI